MTVRDRIPDTLKHLSHFWFEQQIKLLVFTSWTWCWHINPFTQWTETADKFSYLLNVTKRSESAFTAQKRQKTSSISPLQRWDSGIFPTYGGIGFLVHRLDSKPSSQRSFYFRPSCLVKQWQGQWRGQGMIPDYFLPERTVNLRETSGSWRRALIFSWNFSLYWLNCMMLSGSSATQNWSNSYAR